MVNFISDIEGEIKDYVNKKIDDLEDDLEDDYCTNAASSQKISFQIYNNKLEVFKNGKLALSIKGD